MLLTHVDFQFEKNDFSLKVRNGKAFFSAKGQQYRLGSKLYPLGKRAHLFTKNNTEQGDYREVQEAIENGNWTHRDGFCYTNADILHKAFLAHGIDAKYFSGWLFVNNEEPIHHAWVVVDNNVYDIAVHMTSQRALEAQIKRGENPYSARALKEIASLKNQLYPLSDHFTWGKVSDYIYIGAESDPYHARLQFNKAIDSVETHPSYRNKGMNAHGASRYQQLSSQFR